jgi:hypothetical protein
MLTMHRDARRIHWETQLHQPIPMEGPERAIPIVENLRSEILIVLNQVPCDCPLQFSVIQIGWTEPDEAVKLLSQEEVVVAHDGVGRAALLAHEGEHLMHKAEITTLKVLEADENVCFGVAFIEERGATADKVRGIQERAWDAEWIFCS